MSTRVISIETATKAGGNRPNQDRIFTTSNSVILLDGASAVREQRRDGGWYAEQLGTKLAETLERVPNLDLRKALREAIEAVGRQLDSGDGAPSSTVVIARWVDETLDVLVLGDSTAVVYPTRDSPIVLCDNRLDTIGQVERAAYQNGLREGIGFDAEHRERIRQLQKAQLQARNRSDGYWIAADDPTAADNAVLRSFTLGAADALLLASDGLAEMVDNYALMDWAQALKAAEVIGIEHLIALTHQAEEGDPAGERWPRGRLHDDKTLAVVRFQR